MIIGKRLAGTVLALACCGGLAACGGSNNPQVSSGDFVNYCVNQAKSSRNLPLSINLTSTCQCVQQKLVAGGYGNLTATGLRNNTAAARVAAACFTGGSSATPVPTTPSLPGTTTT